MTKLNFLLSDNRTTSSTGLDPSLVTLAIATIAFGITLAALIVF